MITQETYGIQWDGHSSKHISRQLGLWLASLTIPSSCFVAVNRNIAAFGAGTGRLSTDQKKKLLWGNKRSNPSEEVCFSEYMTFFSIFVFISFSLLSLMLQASKRWELFSDRERQEKFNKLMVIPLFQAQF